jgi:hypothetical protein
MTLAPAHEKIVRVRMNAAIVRITIGDFALGS